MTLGFTVEELVPRGRGGAALGMGLSRIPEAGWLQPSFDRGARAAAFERHSDAVQVLPQAEPAIRELAAMLGVSGELGAAARACWEDLCLLQPDADGRYVLTAGAVGFPTDWRLGDKIGLPLAAIHAPIHGYAEQLAAGVHHFFRTLPAGPIHGRANWFVVPNADWRYLPEDDPATRFAHVTAANAGRTLFIRCERQTLRRLPESGAMLFTIGVAVARLDTLSAGVVRRLAGAVAALSPGEHERRAAPGYAEALSGYAGVDTGEERGMSLALFLLAAGAPDPCNAHPASQRDMLRCAVAKRVAAEAELAELLARAERQMRDRDAGDPKRGNLALLREGQAGWTRYRDAQCRLEGYHMRGGSGQPLIENLCLGRMDRARAGDLRNVLGEEE